MLYEAFQLITTGITLEKEGRHDWYEEPGGRNRFIESPLPLLTEFNAVNVLESIEGPIAGDNLDTKFQQAPQRRIRTAKNSSSSLV